MTSPTVYRPGGSTGFRWPGLQWLLLVMVLGLIATLAGLVVYRSGDLATEDTEIQTARSVDRAAVPTAAGAPEAIPPNTTLPDRRPSIETPVRPGTALWPSAVGHNHFEGPRELAFGFAVDYVGFDTPLIGRFETVGANRAQIEVRPHVDGPITLVLLEHSEPGDLWWAIGATTDHIKVTEPVPGARIGDALDYRGDAWTVSDSVEVEVRADGSHVVVAGTEFVTTGNGDGGWFAGRLGFPEQSAPTGSVVFLTRDDSTGEVTEATVIRVSFDPAETKTEPQQ